MTVDLEWNEASAGASFSFDTEPIDPIDELYPFARQVAAGLARRYSLCTLDDITQEIVLYVMTKQKVADEWGSYCEGDFLDEDQARHIGNRMRLIMRRAGERYCRKELGEVLGYKPEDEAFYSIPQLRILVEWYYREGLTERPSRPANDRVSTGGDPGTGGNWLVSLLDVQRGLQRIPRRYKARLKIRYEDLGQFTEAELAKMANNLAVAKGKRQRIERHLGTTEAAIQGRIRLALEKLQKALGGSSPYKKTDLETKQDDVVECE